MRDNPSGSNSNGHCNKKCHVPPSQDLAMTALVLAAEATAALIADNADGGNGGNIIVSSIFFAAGGGVIN